MEMSSEVCSIYESSLFNATPGHFNPADFFLDVVSMDYRSPELEEKTRNRITRLADKWDGLQVGHTSSVLKYIYIYIYIYIYTIYIEE
jgi:hypothetical protein